MTRTLSTTLATIVEELELDQSIVVTLDELRKLAERHRLGTDPKIIASRLRERGWLLPTGQRGVYEFAPGAHAGPIGHADPVLPLRAALATAPQLAAALALSAAAWALGFADRVPTRLDVAVPDGRAVPLALQRNTRVHHFTARLDYTRAKGVPCHSLATILVHLAAAPAAPRSWESVAEWLPALAGSAEGADLERELAGRPRAVTVRTGYLLSGLRPDLAEPLRQQVAGPVRFGPRSAPLRRHSRDWRVLDGVLPFDPSDLPAVG